MSRDILSHLHQQNEARTLSQRRKVLCRYALLRRSISYEDPDPVNLGLQIFNLNSNYVYGFYMFTIDEINFKVNTLQI